MYKYFYMDGDSYYHRLDPRTKLFITLAHYIAIVVLIEQIWMLLALIIEVFILTGTAGTMSNLKRVRIVIIMISVLSIISWLIIGQRETQLWGPIWLEPLCMGISAGLRNNTGIIISVLLLSATRNEELAAALTRLGVPYGGAFAFSSALRMAPVLIGSTLTVVAAQKSRGLDLDTGNIFAKIKRSIPLLVPAFLLTMRSTETFSMAIESKGFGYNNKERGQYLILRFTKADYAWMAYAVLLIAGSITISSLGLFEVFTALN